MGQITYRGYEIVQQREFGPLRLLQWTEDGEFVVVKHGGVAMRGATFQTIDDAKRAIDIIEGSFERVHQALSRPD